MRVSAFVNEGSGKNEENMLAPFILGGTQAMLIQMQNCQPDLFEL